MAEVIIPQSVYADLFGFERWKFFVDLNDMMPVMSDFDVGLDLTKDVESIFDVGRQIMDMLFI